MRELFLFLLYSGQLYFLAAGLFLLVVVFDLVGVLDNRPLARRAARVVALVSILVAALSGTPMPPPVLFFAIGATLPYLFTMEKHRLKPVLRSRLRFAAILAVVIAVAFELPWHVRRGSLRGPSRLIVIGDSLASGGFGERAAWPSLLGVPVVNLAAPSDDAAGALRNQVPDLPAPKAGDLAIVEIGGNDMLEGVDPRAFERSLDQILTALSGRRIVILELPLLPGRWRYGAIQRRAAENHRAVLAPKRILARVLVDPRNTSDGLHLTQRGHEELAGALSAWLKKRDVRQ